MSWDGLLGIMRTAAVEREQSRAGPPEACPGDGEPLKSSLPDGDLRCGFCGWIWDGGPVTW